MFAYLVGPGTTRLHGFSMLPVLSIHIGGTVACHTIKPPHSHQATANTYSTHGCKRDTYTLVADTAGSESSSDSPYLGAEALHMYSFA
ncbi:hypothetical protein F5Y10DRAFT_259672 [Nemania abortiva]|nr:hypothetical protein F5Y10DRAFT_259672 [Nemania abortiva]